MLNLIVCYNKFAIEVLFLIAIQKIIFDLCLLKFGQFKLLNKSFKGSQHIN